MAFLKCLKPAKDHLPDLKGSWAVLVPSCTTAKANLEVQQLLSDNKKEKRDPYNK